MKVVKILSDAVFVLGLLVAGVFLVGKFTGKIPFSAYIVSSGSMEPEIKTGSVVVVSKQPEYKVEDVVTFYTDTSKKVTTTHRIVAIVDEMIRTTGDSNNQPDPTLINKQAIIGKVRFSVPHIGYTAGFAKTPQGFILLVIVPATIIIYEELKAVAGEVRKKITKTVSAKQGFVFPRMALVIPLFFASLITASLSMSFFLDRVTTSATLGIEAPTPQIANTLVVNEVLPNSSCIQGSAEGQFVELWNGTSGTVNLKDFKLSDGINIVAISNPNKNLNSHEFAILVKSNGVINQCLGDIHGAVEVNLGGQINIGTGPLQLLDANNIVIDTIKWGLGENLQPATNSSIERDPTGHDTATGAYFEPSDFVIRNTPQPGL